MPVYAYRCTECDIKFEKRQGFNDDPVTICPECQGEVYRMITPAGVIFKGSGFYITDNKGSSKATTASNGNGNGNGNGSSKSNGDKSESASSAKSESKSETKSESKAKSESKKTASSKAD